MSRKVLKYFSYNILYIVFSLGIMWFVLIIGIAIAPDIYTNEKVENHITEMNPEPLYLVKVPFMGIGNKVISFIQNNPEHLPRLLLFSLWLYIFFVEKIYDKMMSYHKAFYIMRNEKLIKPLKESFNKLRKGDIKI